MRLPVAVFALLLASCGRQAPPIADELRETRLLLYREKFGEALTRAQDGANRAPRNSPDIWIFRLLQAEALLGQRHPDDADAVLRSLGEPAAGEIQARWLLVRGRVHYAKNQNDKAAAEFETAADTARAAGAEALAAEAELRQGLLLLRRQKLDEARERFVTLAATAAKLQEPYLQASAVANIGFVLQSQHRYEEAVPWFEQAVTLFGSIGAAESVARNHGNLGSCYWGLGDYDNASLHYKLAQEGFAKTGNLDSQQIWAGNAANVPYELGDYTAAGQGYERALEIARKVGNQARVGLWLANLAATEVETGKWDAAARYNAEALSTLHGSGDHQWDMMLAVNSGRIAEGRGDVETAREAFRGALLLQSDDASARLDAHAGMARLFIRGGRVREADAEFRKTVGMIESLRKGLVKDDYKVSYLASLIRFYREYVEFLIGSGQAERALEVADSSRARLLEERNGDSARQSNYKTADYQRIARKTGATLLEYLLGPRKSYLWVVTGAGVRLHELPGRDEIRALAVAYRAVVTGGRNPLEVAASTGQKLYNILLRPAVTGPGRFVIVPDQDLYSFNPETLPAESGGKFWIEDATVAIVPSLGYLASRSGERSIRKPEGLLAMGDALSSNTQYPKLQYAGQEIDTIRSRVGGQRSETLKGEAATPRAYAGARPQQFGYIHFAAHAAANQQSPLDSAVILSGTAGNNRLLARDVMKVPLTAELVTISACRSAGGKTYAGEGLVGFAWAFLRAGARNVIAGLWDVNDRSTTQLMTSLYSEVAAGKTPPDALRAAKLALIRGGGTYAKPFYWAPFQVYAGAM